ncbi:glycoside hydrolase family protein [Embleya sp. NPDC020630]|uniref:glycoside hydrolase family protein n=1 Tax=Embleya sp. NPDC020630 TaxID=3363979 RepID=UPI00379DDD53
MFTASERGARAPWLRALAAGLAVVGVLGAGAAPVSADPVQVVPCPDGTYPALMSPQQMREFVAGHESANGLAGDKHVYTDSTGHPTIGVGFRLDRGDSRAMLTAVGADYDAVREGRADLTGRQIALLFEATYDQAAWAAEELVPGYAALPTTRQAVLVDMVFNMGKTGVGRFTGMLTALANGDYDAAAAEMRKSVWAKQVGARAIEASRLMKLGYVCSTVNPDGPPPVSSDIPGRPKSSTPGGGSAHGGTVHYPDGETIAYGGSAGPGEGCRLRAWYSDYAGERYYSIAADCPGGVSIVIQLS